MSARGRFFFSTHAIERFIQRIDRNASWDEAIARLVRASDNASFVRRERHGRELWVSKYPDPIRMVVTRSQSVMELPVVVTVVEGKRAAKKRMEAQSDLSI